MIVIFDIFCQAENIYTILYYKIIEDSIKRFFLNPRNNFKAHSTFDLCEILLETVYLTLPFLVKTKIIIIATHTSLYILSLNIAFFILVTIYM